MNLLIPELLELATLRKDLTLKEIKTIDDYLRELQNLYFKALESGEFVLAYDVLVTLSREIAFQQKIPWNFRNIKH